MAAAQQDDPRDVEIELELPQHKIDELLRQLREDGSDLKAEFPLALVTEVTHAPPRQAGREEDQAQQSLQSRLHGRPSAVSQLFGQSSGLRAADAWDPLEKLANLKTLQSRYGAVRAQIERAENTKRLLSQVPSAGDAQAQAPLSQGAPPPSQPSFAPPEFPPPGGLPFPYSGVPGVLSPRAKPPPEPEKDFTDGATALEAVKDIKAVEPTAETSVGMAKEDIMLAKDGLDMSLNHLRSAGSKMRNNVRELSRKVDEAIEISDVKKLAAGEPVLQEELVRQQRLIHEQQRVADEARYELELEKERTFWTRRDKLLQPQEIDNFKLNDDDTPQTWPPDNASLLQQSEASDNLYPAMRHMMPELAPEGTGPQSRYRFELPATIEYHSRLRAEAEAEGWPSAEEALAVRDEQPAPPRVVRSARQPTSPREEPQQEPPTRGGFFAGYGDRREAASGRDFGFAARGPPRHDAPGESNSADEDLLGAVDAYGRPLAEQPGYESAFAKSLPAARRGANNPPFAAFAGFGGTADQEEFQAAVGSRAGMQRKGLGAELRSPRPFSPAEGAISRDLSELRFAAFAGDEQNEQSFSSSGPRYASSSSALRNSTAGQQPKAAPNSNLRERNRADLRHIDSDDDFEQQANAPPAAQQTAPPASSSFTDFFGGGEALQAKPREPESEEESEEETEKEEPEYEEEGYLGTILNAVGATQPRLKKKAPIDPGARFMTGACLVRNPPLEVPDVKELRANLASADKVFKDLFAAREEGKFGTPEIAKLALGYVVTLSIHAEKLAKKGDAWKYVGLATDVLHFYPLCAPIHLWALEAMMGLLRYETNDRADQLARPIFDSVTSLMTTHLQDPGLRTATPELPVRLLASIALALTPDNVTRLTSSHVDFALQTMSEPEVSPLTTEHGLQVILMAASKRNLKDQAEASKIALRCFKAESRLVPRALLALSTIFQEANKAGDSSVLTSEIAPSDYVEPEGESEEFQVPVAFRDITTTMDVYAQDRKIQGAGSQALENAALITGVSLQALIRDGLLRSLTLAHQRFPTSRSVALSLCRVIGRIALQQPDLLSIEVGIAALSAGASLPRDGEVVVASLEAVFALAPKLKDLWTGSSKNAEKLALMAADLVKLGEVRHKHAHSVGLLLVIMTTACSNGHGDQTGGVPAEQWRLAFGRAAGVALPLRALYEHSKNVDMVTAAGIALRVLTSDSPASCQHAGRARAGAILLSSLNSYASKPATVRELLSALANCASAESVRQDYKRGLPQTEDVIYYAMESSAHKDADVLAQGCRALGALNSKSNTAINLGLEPGEKPKFTPVLQWTKLNICIIKAVIGIAVHNGESVEAGLLDNFSAREEKLQAQRRRLAELCSLLAQGSLGAGPQFGRMLNKAGEPTAECTPRWSAVRTRLQKRAERQRLQADPQAAARASRPVDESEEEQDEESD
eukprot:TRINITY_DN23647_c0_g1_i1.p1 TRINITY_DN23647_c0_g1~~TRINITY_DN23647_c0_g1_i1.p1  ORF type:complete len:1441 (-),score=306.76 TRINITY_DN23647_c0_g1_i1:60-4382(-)